MVYRQLSVSHGVRVTRHLSLTPLRTDRKLSLSGMGHTWCLVLLALGLFLRLYNFEVVAWIPDSYDRLADATRLANGQLPQSRLYPPAISLLMAPLFTVLPNSFETMQILIIACGVGLILLAYIAALKLTADKF